MLAAGLIGYAGGRLAPEKFAVGGGHGAAKEGHGPALIDDHTPLPPHARFAWRRLRRVLVFFVALWLAALGAICAPLGWSGTLAQTGSFFTKAALMIDGLALGEAMPGLLIMVVVFVGFVGGWTKALVGGDSLFLAGAAAATVATVFTFLPSFCFILVGAPLIESTHGKLRFTAPLTGITAAVIGVIVNLAVFLAWHALWPQGWDGTFEWPAARIGLAAALALLRLKLGVITVIAGSARAGPAWRLLSMAA